MEYYLHFSLFCIFLVACFSWSSILLRLQGIERKLNAILAHFEINPTFRLPLSDRVKELAADPNRKIEAIKVYREETAVGLAEAKEAVEFYINNKMSSK